MLASQIYQVFEQQKALLRQLNQRQYTAPCHALSNSTIGQHTRHIIELFQCLVKGLEKGLVNYDSRERNMQIETDTHFAIDCMNRIEMNLEKPDQQLQLMVNNRSEYMIDTNYYRELLYNLEHCIHHQALIKVALLTFGNISVSENFGVAPATIEYRLQCAQ
jgi:hypothetical protein